MKAGQPPCVHRVVRALPASRRRRFRQHGTERRARSPPSRWARGWSISSGTASCPKKKNWALAQVAWRYEWVFILDADERITPALAVGIAAGCRRDSGCNGFAGYYAGTAAAGFLGGWLRHCGYYPSWNLRTFSGTTRLAGMRNSAAAATPAPATTRCMSTCCFPARPATSGVRWITWRFRPSTSGSRSITATPTGRPPAKLLSEAGHAVPQRRCPRTRPAPRRASAGSGTFGVHGCRSVRCCGFSTITSFARLLGRLSRLCLLPADGLYELSMWRKPPSCD